MAKKEEELKLEPLADRLLVRRQAGQKVTDGGILLPDTAQQKAQRGTVLAAGPGLFYDKLGKVLPPNVAVGDEVLFTRYAGHDVPELGEDVLILSETDVLCKVVE